MQRAEPEKAATRPRRWKGVRALRRSASAATGLAVVVLFAAAALAAPLLVPFDPMSESSALQAPSADHMLGTDEHGRDVLSRILVGARTSLLIGLLSVGIAVAAGGVIGALAGYFGGALDAFLMRVMDVMLSFPSILLAILIVALLGPSLTNTMIAVGVVNVPVYARLVRASVLAEKQREYVAAARSMGAGHPRILLRGILPNCGGPVLVQGTLGFATAILDAAGLSFLGLGAQPPTIEWGLMLSSAKDLITTAWWVITFPGLAILLTVLGFNLLGDGLRDVLDPRSRPR